MLNVQLKKRWTLLQSVVFVMFLLSSTLAFAQNRVTGKVTDRTGMPLPGVNVLEKGQPTEVSQMWMENTSSMWPRARPYSSLTLVSQRKK